MLGSILQSEHADGRDDRELVRAVQHWIQENIKYVKEHPETYAQPLRTLKWGLGDCDDQVILLCSLLRTARVPCRARFGFWTVGPGPADRRGHVWSDVGLGGKWVAAETVKKVPLGWDPLAFVASKGFTPTWFAIGDPVNQVR